MITPLSTSLAGLRSAASLAQASTPAARPALTPLFIFLGLGVLVAVLATLAVLAIRRRILTRDSSVAGQNRLLDDLRAMRNRGDISPEEFDRARHLIASRLAGAPNPGAPAGPRPRPATPAEPGALRARPGFDLTGAPLPAPEPGAPTDDPPQAPPDPPPHAADR